ncbi:MAG: 3-phosphoglycerate dehydrogenase, partial [Clostridia bacterium]|nr:3-phosphoglycerate dehydrogenase [Clostridia bacterium]
ASAELKDFLENGNIKNSVNCPVLSLAKIGKARVTVLTKETEAETAVKETLAAFGVKSIASKTRGEVTYVIADLESAPTDDAVNALSEKALKVRVL